MSQGTITALITMRDDIITEAQLELKSNEPINYSVSDLESGLIGTLMDFESLKNQIRQITDNQFVKDWAESIYKVKELQMQQTGNGALARSN